MIRVKEGDHNGRFILPTGESVHGVLTLAANRPPSVSLHPDAPGGQRSEGSVAFPRDSRTPELVGHLFSNDEVIIGDVVLSEWFPFQIQAFGRWALVGLEITRVPDRRWNTLQLQVSGLEALLGNAIASTLWPTDTRADPQRLSADLNIAANFTSSSDTVSATAKYRYSFPITDPYRFSVTNYATVFLTADEPLPADEWIQEWVNPLIGLVALATGERERLNSALFSAPDPTRATDDARMPAEITGQLFGAGIHQQDIPAQRRTRPDGTPLVPLFHLADAPPLADLIRRWRTGPGERTATTLYRLSTDPTLPAPVRYLLCAQALEALHSEDHATQEAAQDVAHAEERAAALASLAALPDDLLDPRIKRFLKRNVARRPLRSLAGRLSQILTTVPDSDTLVANWTSLTEPLVLFLAERGYLIEPLHERLASIRNILSHGSAIIPDRPLAAATRILETLLRGQLLASLGFNDMQIGNAYAQMSRDDA
jgi:ApeA N-terminal domain 1